MKGKVLGLLLVGLVAIMMTPMGGSHPGGWWRARDLPASSTGMGLDHDAHPISTATEVATGRMFQADVTWSGQQFVGPGLNGWLTLKFFDDAGVMVHQATIPALEQNPQVLWIQCPAGTGDPWANLMTVPEYSLTTPGVLDLQGIARYSFCGFDQPGDFYFKNFSDYEGTYLLDGLFAYHLHLHGRGMDHG